MRYDRASNQLDRHPNCILAAYMATEPDAPIRDQDHRCIRPSPARADEWGATLAAMSSMYGLSPETDLSPLNGCMLTFVGFGQYQLQLAFSGDADCSISIEGDYTVAPRGHEPTTYSEAVAGATALLPILGHTVTSAMVPSDGTVRVVFDDGSVVEVLDSLSHYESYQISLGGHRLIV